MSTLLRLIDGGGGHLIVGDQLVSVFVSVPGFVWHMALHTEAGLDGRFFSND